MKLNMIGMRLVLIAVAILSVTAIKVPLENAEANNTETQQNKENEDEVDSYLVPPNPHRREEGFSDDIATPATYLLPPSVNEQTFDYYKPTESGEQTDWYPIAPAASPLYRALLPPKQSEVNANIEVVNHSEPIFGSFRTGKVLDQNRILPIPSRALQPPLENAPNDYIAIIPDEATNIQIENERTSHRPVNYPLSVWNGPIISVPNNIRANPYPKITYTTKKYKSPTILYPKKYGVPFKPVPIPLAQFSDESLTEIPKAKPLKQFTPNQIAETELITPLDEKKIYKYQEAQKKRKLKGEPETIKIEESEVSTSDESVLSPEQDTSETNYRIPLRNVYPAPLRQAPPTVPSNTAQNHKPPADGERTEFRMHGMKGPHSYQFGFDTGKGKNRQFRFEERDNDGRVKGHYGYVDKHGKLRVVNYDADPEHGFRAEAPVETE